MIKTNFIFGIDAERQGGVRLTDQIVCPNNDKAENHI
jgi:hypothetical protein